VYYGKKNKWKIKQQFIETPQTYTLQAFHLLINIAENWWVIEDIHRPIVVRFFRREHKEEEEEEKEEEEEEEKE